MPLIDASLSDSRKPCGLVANCCCGKTTGRQIYPLNLCNSAATCFQKLDVNRLDIMQYTQSIADYEHARAAILDCKTRNIVRHL